MTGDAQISGNLAAIDIGTNSIHMVVARPGEGGRFEVLASEKEMVRLGSGGGDMKELSADAIDRAVATLGRFRQIAEISDAPITAVATSAVREAENAAELIDRARDEAGVEIEVISGYEEARLIHLGVLQAVPMFEQLALVVDIGGGSTEIVVGREGRTLLVRSLKLGAIRLTRRFFGSDLLHPGAIAACRSHVRSTLAPVVREVRDIRHAEIEVAVASSGTAMAVAEMAHAGRDAGPRPQTFNNFELTRKEVGLVVQALASHPTVEARRSVPALDPKRADIILAGAIIFDEVLHAFGLKTIVISELALREGVLLDALERSRGGAMHHLHDVRRQSVLHLAELCDPEPEHSAHVAVLALELFDETTELHGLGDVERELLEAAALLANVGLFVSHSQHHRHSYYVIRNSEHLSGFTDHEIELIAQVARYHRKSAPKKSHAEFSRLDDADQTAVRTLAAILRVAIGLDRTHSAAVRSLACTCEDDALTIEVAADDGTDVSLELYTADERKSLLEKVLDRRIVLEAR